MNNNSEENNFSGLVIEYLIRQVLDSIVNTSVTERSTPVTKKPVLDIDLEIALDEAFDKLIQQ
jgi:hypothetical protein